MNILSHRTFRLLRTEYRKRHGLELGIITPDGRMVTDSRLKAPYHLPVLVRARADALQQAVRWGESYVFFLAPEVISWIVPLVDGTRILGGLAGGEVVAEEDMEDRLSAVNYLVEAGCSRRAADRFVSRMQAWPQERTREAANHLFELAYQVSGLKPALLTQNRENALQQRQIGEAIQERKQATDHAYPLREERLLLSLMRVGDRNGSRRVLNNMLAAMFLSSPNLLLIRARSVEMMGFLVRAAIEESPIHGPLMKKHQEWTNSIIESGAFEELCVVLRHALDDFIGAIFMQGYNRSSGNVRRILNYISEHYMTSLRLETIAEAVGLSPYYVARLVKRNTGKTVTQHIRSMRINKACDFLQFTEMPYAEIAYSLGFADQSYFIRQFREMTGTTPARFRSARQFFTIRSRRIHETSRSMASPSSVVHEQDHRR